MSASKWEGEQRKESERVQEREQKKYLNSCFILFPLESQKSSRSVSYSFTIGGSAPATPCSACGLLCPYREEFETRLH